MGKVSTGLRTAVMVCAAFAGGFVASCVTATGPATASQDVVEVRELRLIDSEGNVCGVLGILSDGMPRLALHDANSDAKAFLGVLGDRTPALALADGDGVTRTVLETTGTGRSGLTLSDRRGSRRVALGVLEDGSCGIAFHDAAEQEMASLAVQAAGTGSVFLSGKHGELGWQVEGLPIRTAPPQIPGDPRIIRRNR